MVFYAILWHSLVPILQKNRYNKFKNQTIMTIKENILELLRTINRQGIDKVIDWLKDSDFFEAPASTNFHGNYEGGLAEHSFNVYQAAIQLREAALKLNPTLEPQLPTDSIIIASLLHDVCKVDVYKTRQRKNELGVWEECDGYTVDYSKFPLGHGEKSVILLLKLGLELTDAEIAAIRWHMTAWYLPFQRREILGNINAAKNKYPLCSVIQMADGFAASLMEEKKA